MCKVLGGQYLEAEISADVVQSGAYDGQVVGEVAVGIAANVRSPTELVIIQDNRRRWSRGEFLNQNVSLCCCKIVIF